MTSAGAAVLQGLTSLEVLALDRCVALHGAVPALQGLQRLRGLSLQRCTGVSAPSVMMNVAACTALSTLSLSWCKGSPQQWAAEQCLNQPQPWAALQRLDAVSAVLPASVLNMLRSRPLVDLDLSACSLLELGTPAASANTCDLPQRYGGLGPALADVAALTGITRLAMCRVRVRTAAACLGMRYMVHVN